MSYEFRRKRKISLLCSREMAIPISVVLVLLSCTQCSRNSKSTPNKSSTTQQQEGQLQTDTMEADDIVAAWNQAAAHRKVPKANCDAVAKELSDVLGYIKVHPTPAQVALCKMSFENILLSQTGLYDEKRTEGTAKWIAWCTAEALKQPQLSDEERLHVAADYHQFAQELIAHMRTSLVAKIPKERQAAYIPEIDRWFADWRSNMDKWTGTLQEDLLFPAFRAALPAKAKQELLTKYDNPNMYPDWDNSPGAAMMNPDDRYRSLLESWFKNSLHCAMFYMTIAEVKPRILVNRYWGHTLHSSTGTNELWPLDVTLNVWQSKNIETKWKREPK